MSQLYDRQPVILDPDVYREWLHPATPGTKANLDERLEFHRVRKEVNSTRFEAIPAPEVNSL